MRAVVLLAVVAIGCGGAEPGSETPARVAVNVNPGTGVVVAGKTLAIGDTYGAVRAELGAANRLRDLGDEGTLFEYTSHHLAGTLTGPGDDATVVSIVVTSGADARIDGGVGIGSTKAEIEAALGPANQDPFLGTLWYRDRGVAFDMETGVAVRAHVF